MKQFTKIFGLVNLILVSNHISFAQTNNVGLGIILGEPTGVSLKVWTSRTIAIDGAAAWSFSNPGAFHIHADYLMHSFNLIMVSGGGRVPLYYGIGGRIKFSDENTQLGVRIPVGLDYIFPDQKFDLFVEVVPILDLAPKTKLQFNAALGARYFF